MVTYKLFRLKGGKLYLNGMCFEALICGYAPAIPQALADFISANPEFPVFYVQDRPWKVITDTGVRGLNLDSCRTVDLPDLAKCLADTGVAKIRIEPSSDELTVYHYSKNGQIFVLLNESAETPYRGQVLLPTAEKLCVYDGWTDRYLEVEGQHRHTRRYCHRTPSILHNSHSRRQFQLAPTGRHGQCHPHIGKHHLV